MPRGIRKTMSTKEKLQQVTEAIAAKENEIKELRAEKKELEKKIKDEELADLYAIISNSGKTIEEVKEMLSK